MRPSMHIHGGSILENRFEIELADELLTNRLTIGVMDDVMRQQIENDHDLVKQAWEDDKIFNVKLSEGATKIVLSGLMEAMHTNQRAAISLYSYERHLRVIR